MVERKYQIQQAFRDYIRRFIDDVSQVFPREHITDLLIIKTYMSTQSDEHLIRVVEERSRPHRKELKKRNEKYFNQYALHIFGELPHNHVEIFRNFVLSTTEQNRKCIWSYIDALIRLSVEYTKLTLTPDQLKLFIQREQELLES